MEGIRKVLERHLPAALKGVGRQTSCAKLTLFRNIDELVSVNTAPLGHHDNTSEASHPLEGQVISEHLPLFIL